MISIKITTNATHTTNLNVNRKPGGVMIQKVSIDHDIDKIKDVSFDEGRITFCVVSGDEEKTITHQTVYPSTIIKELYDLISNHELNYLYMNSDKKFEFISPKMLQNFLFEVEWEICKNCSKLDDEYIGTIEIKDGKIFGRPCLSSRQYVTLDDIVNEGTNTLYLDFSQYTKINGTVFVDENFSDFHCKYQDFLTRLSVNFDDFIFKNPTFRTLNDLNKICQLLYLINEFGDLDVEKLNDTYEESFDSFNVTINGVTHVATPIGSRAS